ncbi:hypothetical protein [Magnetofaba australis]|uniref:Uncharacterized protein n=1 Tax=Magnetofaba australis IT-1 TaxID=1434232 RepID=A0A1Y2K554_9PROT|nr:hypothetical protein [Magnetofaba australis]OSM04366.1 hypothetical protein MAIT1_04264 [Magnetofaba australis IT-1]
MTLQAIHTTRETASAIPLHPLHVAYDDKRIALAIDSLREALQGDLPINAIIDQLCLWLNRHIAIEMVGYWNPRRGAHVLACDKRNSPEEAQLADQVAEMMEGALPRMSHWRRDAWVFHLREGAPMDKFDRLVIVERGERLPVESANTLMREIMAVLSEPLERAWSESHPATKRRVAVGY